MLLPTLMKYSPTKIMLKNNPCPHEQIMEEYVYISNLKYNIYSFSAVLMDGSVNLVCSSIRFYAIAGYTLLQKRERTICVPSKCLHSSFPIS